MNFKTTLILILLLVLVGGYIVFDRTSPTTPPASPPAPEKLVTVSYNDVNTLSISPSAGSAVTLEKRGENWQITKPFSAPADKSVVGQYIAALTAAESKGEPDTAAQSSFTPTVSVELAGRKFEVSARNAVGDAVVKISDSAGTRWFLTDGTLPTTLTKTPDSFRDPRLVTATIPSIQSLSLEYPDTTLRLAKSGDHWTVAEGDKPAIKADDASVSELLQTVIGLRAAEYPGQTPIAAFNTTQLTVKFTATPPAASTAPSTQPAIAHTIRFGRYEDARKERVIVASDDVVAYGSTYPLNALKKTLLDLRNKELLDLKPGEITSFKIRNIAEATTRPETAQIFTLQPGVIRPPATAPSAPTWNVGSEPADPAKVEALLAAVRTLTAAKFLSGDAATKPAFTHTLTVHVSGVTHEIQVSPTALRLGDLTFEPTTDLSNLLAGPFAKPKPVPSSQPSPPTSPTTTPTPTP